MLNVQASNNRALKSMNQKQTKLKGEIHQFTVMVGEVNTPVSVRGRIKREKVRMGSFITRELSMLQAVF